MPILKLSDNHSMTVDLINKLYITTGVDGTTIILDEIIDNKLMRSRILFLHFLTLHIRKEMSF